MIIYSHNFRNQDEQNLCKNKKNLWKVQDGTKFYFL